MAILTTSLVILLLLSICAKDDMYKFISKLIIILRQVDPGIVAPEFLLHVRHGHDQRSEINMRLRGQPIKIVEDRL
jgi:hypothetical protein